MTKRQLWEIYDNSPAPKYYWEHWDEKAFPRGSGLLLSICPHCSTKQTRENYISCRPGSFWSEWITLIQDYEITGVAKCAKCGGWCQVYG